MSVLDSFRGVSLGDYKGKWGHLDGGCYGYSVYSLYCQFAEEMPHNDYIRCRN